MSYRFKFRRGLFYKTLMVDGHRYESAIDKMVLYFPDGSIEEIPEWKKYRLRLGLDWMAAVKKQMEKEAGTAISLAK